MAIKRVLEFAQEGKKSLVGLATHLGFPREEKPAREWFNYLFNIIFGTLNELIDEVNLLRLEVENIKSVGVPTIPEGGGTPTPTPTPVPPYIPPPPAVKPTDGFMAYISHTGAPGIASSSGSAMGQLVDTKLDGQVGRIAQIINYKTTTGGGSYQMRRTTAGINNGAWEANFPLTLEGSALTTAGTQDNITHISYIFSIAGQDPWERTASGYRKNP